MGGCKESPIVRLNVRVFPVADAVAREEATSSLMCKGDSAQKGGSPTTASKSGTTEASGGRQRKYQQQKEEGKS